MRPSVNRRVLAWAYTRPAPGPRASRAEIRSHLQALRLCALLGEGKVGSERNERENRRILEEVSDELRRFYP